jgi:hypothetical protein
MLLAIIVAAVSVAATLGVVWFALEDVADQPSHWSGRLWRVENGVLTISRKPA